MSSLSSSSSRSRATQSANEPPSRLAASVTQNEATRLLLSAISTTDSRRYTQARGPKVQRYSPNGEGLMDTYSGFTDAARDLTLDNPVAPMIREAAKNKTIYKGFRWAMLDRALDDTTVQQIGETLQSKQVKTGAIAMLHLNKTHIVEVFPDMSAASEARGFASCSAISTALRNQKPSSGHYWSSWYDCSDELKAQYLTTHKLPPPRLRVNAELIEQVHPLTQTVLKTYASIAHVQREMRVSVTCSPSERVQRRLFVARLHLEDQREVKRRGFRAPYQL